MFWNQFLIFIPIEALHCYDKQNSFTKLVQCLTGDVLYCVIDKLSSVLFILLLESKTLTSHRINKKVFKQFCSLVN